MVKQRRIAVRRSRFITKTLLHIKQINNGYIVPTNTNQYKLRNHGVFVYYTVHDIESVQTIDGPMMMVKLIYNNPVDPTIEIAVKIGHLNNIDPVYCWRDKYWSCAVNSDNIIWCKRGNLILHEIENLDDSCISNFGPIKHAISSRL